VSLLKKSLTNFFNNLTNALDLKLKVKKMPRRDRKSLYVSNAANRQEEDRLENKIE